MSTSVTLPALGESVTEGTVTRWLKQVGDRVEADEPLLEVSTDKVDTEIPSPASGTLVEIKAQEDDTVPVGGDLAVIAGDDETDGSSPAAPAASDTPASDTAASDTAASDTAPAAAPEAAATPAEAPPAEAPAPAEAE